LRAQSEHKKENRIKTGLMLSLIAFISIIAFPFWIPIVLRGIFLRFKFLKAVLTQGKYIIFVYSNSPNWKSYIEENILPQIQDHAILLNWSDRRQWDKTEWAVQAFHHWGGRDNFNPLAIVFCNFVDVRVIRFYSAFHDFKHGKVNALQKVEAHLLELIKTKTRQKAA
jgi:hypothetical protein